MFAGGVFQFAQTIVGSVRKVVRHGNAGQEELGKLVLDWLLPEVSSQHNVHLSTVHNIAAFADSSRTKLRQNEKQISHCVQDMGTVHRATANGGIHRQFRFLSPVSFSFTLS